MANQKPVVQEGAVAVETPKNATLERLQRENAAAAAAPRFNRNIMTMVNVALMHSVFASAHAVKPLCTHALHATYGSDGKELTFQSVVIRDTMEQILSDLAPAERDTVSKWLDARVGSPVRENWSKNGEKDKPILNAGGFPIARSKYRVFEDLLLSEIAEGFPKASGKLLVAGRTTAGQEVRVEVDFEGHEANQEMSEARKYAATQNPGVSGTVAQNQAALAGFQKSKNAVQK